ncbi:MAG: HlyC/CorC family transporter [Pirellulales bacterium]|nr:HlyC/CorC family transporter [Pirellulales bacterium]
MIEDPALWLTIVSFAVTAITAIGHRALRDFSRHDLAEICMRNNDQNRLGDIVRHHERVAVGVETLQVLATALLVSSTTYWLWFEPFRANTLGWNTLLVGGISAGLILLAGEIWVPWAVARLWAEPFVYYTWRFWKAVSTIAWPLVFFASMVDTVLHRLARRPPQRTSEETFEEEIRTLVSEGHREGLLEEDAREMIESVIELSDVAVSQVMTPRTDMDCMRAGLSVREALEFVSHAAHSRIPVYGKNRDDIVGILYAKDVLQCVARGADLDQEQVEPLLRRPHFVPETKPIDRLLQEFQHTRNHIAIVLDEFGGVCGLVTIEDVLEEIVGEIIDEYDEVEAEGIKQLDDRTAEVLARVHIDEINERLGLKIDDQSDFDTIGGFVFSRLGHMPRGGESIVWNNVRITVIEVSRRRIQRLLIEVLDEAHPQGVQ